MANLYTRESVSPEGDFSGTATSTARSFAGPFAHDDLRSRWQAP
jgi:hypothetical protein